MRSGRFLKYCVGIGVGILFFLTILSHRGAIGHISSAVHPVLPAAQGAAVRKNQVAASLPAASSARAGTGVVRASSSSDQVTVQPDARAAAAAATQTAAATHTAAAAAQIGTNQHMSVRGMNSSVYY
eukprot:scpid105555/ scgid17726/ 